MSIVRPPLCRYPGRLLVNRVELRQSVGDKLFRPTVTDLVLRGKEPRQSLAWPKMSDRTGLNEL